MGRVLKTTSGGGSSGISASQVNTLIQAQNEYEFITKVQSTGNVSEYLVTAGIDHTKYSRHKYLITQCETYSNNYFSWHLLQADGTTRWSRGGAWRSNFNTNNSQQQSSITSSSYLYFDGQARSSGFNLIGEIEIIDDKNRNDGTGDYYITAYTRTSMGKEGGYWNMYTDGNAYFRNPNQDTHGGISIRDTVKNITVLIYGMRRR
jgi:hypothetical protein